MHVQENLFGGVHLLSIYTTKVAYPKRVASPCLSNILSAAGGERGLHRFGSIIIPRILTWRRKSSVLCSNQRGASRGCQDSENSTHREELLAHPISKTGSLSVDDQIAFRDAYLVKILIRNESETELWTAAKHTSRTALEECLEPLFAVYTHGDNQVLK